VVLTHDLAIVTAIQLDYDLGMEIAVLIGHDPEMKMAILLNHCGGLIVYLQHQCLSCLE
jgi:hypothetical protein